MVDDALNHRFVLEIDGAEAELDYRENDRRLVLVHTWVPEELRRRGIAGRLVATAVERAQREGLIVVPVCPYAVRWLEEHPDVAARVSIDRRPDDA